MFTAPETDRRQRRLAIIADVQSALLAVTDVEQLFQMLYAQLDRVMDASGLILGLYDETSHMVDVVGQVEAGVFLPGGSFPLGNGFLSEVIRTRQPRHIRHWSAEGPRVQVQYATGTPGLPESTVTVPLLIGSRVVGVLSVQSHAPEAYDNDDAFLLQALAAQIAPAIFAFQNDHAIKAVQRVSKLEAVLASMQDGLLIVDRDGRIVSLNPPARAIFGPMGAGIILGQALDREEWGNWPLGAKSIAEALTPLVEALQRGEAQRDVEVELNAQGRRVLSFSSAPITDAYGLAGGVIVIRDVTTERDVARLRDDLLSIAAHDLRTPATVLRLQAQMMQREVTRHSELPDTWSDRVQTILDQTDRLSNMLNLLLDLSRVEAGRVDLRLERTDLMQFIRQLTASVQSLTSIHSIRLQGPQRVEGCWDIARLEQVMQNLLTNAIKYSPEGGDVLVNVTADRREVTVSVSDQGLGIPRDELPHLFDRFYRVAQTRGLEGSGLGLYVCRGIISAHGGRIWATSDGVGQGSTFWLTIPRTATQHQVL